MRESSFPYEGFCINEAVKFARRHPQFDLDDLIQEARIAVWEASQTANGNPKQFWAYARNAIKWKLNGVFLKRKSLVSGSLDDEFGRAPNVRTRLQLLEMKWVNEGNPTVYATNPEQLLIAAQRYDHVWHAVYNGAGLTALQRRVLRLRYREGREVTEVAKKLRCTEGNVACNSLRAIAKLRRYFGVPQ